MVNYLVYAFDYPKSYYAEFILRYEKVLHLLEKEEELKSKYRIVKPKKLELEECEIVHDKDYLGKLKENLKKDGKIKEGIISDLLGASGTVYACELALKEGSIAYHLGGGFHHAFRDRKGGFDYLNDIAIAVEWLREKHNVRKIAVIDLDVHHANGTQEIFYDDPGVLQISFHGWGIFPGTGDVKEIGEKDGEGYKINLPLLSGTTDDTYLWAMERIIPKYIQLYKPDFIIYQSGVDCMVKDPLGNLKLTLEGVYARDEKIKKLAKGYRLAVIRGGGYNNDYSPKANLNTLACFSNHLIVYKYGKKVSEPGRCRKWAERKIEELERLLSKYW